ncbi:MAG: hypothetical protein M0R77_15585 [Gammaproteobacteria bacterium]|nr:hypothetical protein [Gammaproteobacteria bacterium]
MTERRQRRPVTPRRRSGFALALALLSWLATMAWAQHSASEGRQVAAALHTATEHRVQSITARHTLAAYQARYEALRARGLFAGATRLAWVEAVRRSAAARGLEVHYELAPATTSDRADGVILETAAMQLTLNAPHEGRLLGFLEVLARDTPGVLRVRQCALARAPVGIDVRCRVEWLTLRMAGEETA